MPRKIGLVSCVKSKRDEAAPPKDLYTSDYFEKMRRYAEKHHEEWYILSAKYGLLAPKSDPIAPYDETLRNASKAERQKWAERVVRQLDGVGILTDDASLLIHAGKDYYEELIPLIEDRAASIEIPTEGLGIGEKKAWYKENL